jgi:hypothetical protein
LRTSRARFAAEGHLVCGRLFLIDMHPSPSGSHLDTWTCKLPDQGSRSTDTKPKDFIRTWDGDSSLLISYHATNLFTLRLSPVNQGEKVLELRRQ